LNSKCKYLFLGGSYEHGDESSDSIEGGEFLD